MTEEVKPTTTKQTGPHFIPKLRGKKVTIRLVTGGQPITGFLEGYNAYEILIKTAKGQILVFHSHNRAGGYAPTTNLHAKRMTSLQSPRDRVLWILANSGGRMERSRLRRCAGTRLADLNLILGELAREGGIRITGEMVSMNQ